MVGSAGRVSFWIARAFSQVALRPAKPRLERALGMAVNKSVY